MALVLSDEYTYVDDNKRQAQVWNLLAEKYGDDVALEVEFVFTLTPEEHEELKRATAKEDALDEPRAQVAAGS